MTFAPSRASSRATALPIPWVLPHTSAFLPVKSRFIKAILKDKYSCLTLGMVETVLDNEWGKLLETLSLKFGELEIEGLIFLIGVQELGKGYQKFRKDEKLEVMHVAICTL